MTFLSAHRNPVVFLGLLSLGLLARPDPAAAQRPKTPSDPAKRRPKRGDHLTPLEGVRAEGPVGLPRGVAFDHATRAWTYVFPEAERVREVFRLWLTSDGGLAFAEIARRTGIGEGSAANRSWAVRSILQQPLYRGVYRVDRRWVKGRAVPRDPEDVYEHRVLDPPLVDPADWRLEVTGLVSRPLSLDLDDIRLGQVTELFLEQDHRLSRVCRAGPHDQGMG